MEKQAFFQDFQQKIIDMIKASPAADIERNLKALMGQTFNRLELVSREEFDIQSALLQSLQTRVDALENQLARQSSAPDLTDGAQPDKK